MRAGWRRMLALMRGRQQHDGPAYEEMVPLNLRQVGCFIVDPRFMPASDSALLR